MFHHSSDTPAWTVRKAQTNERAATSRENMFFVLSRRRGGGLECQGRLAEDERGAKEAEDAEEVGSGVGEAIMPLPCGWL